MWSRTRYGFESRRTRSLAARSWTVECRVPIVSVGGTTSRPEHGCTVDPVLGKVAESEIRAVKGVRRRDDTKVHGVRQRQQLLPIQARVGGDAPEDPLLEEVSSVVQLRYRAQVDAGDREGPARHQRLQGRRDEFSHRGEQDG